MPRYKEEWEYAFSFWKRVERMTDCWIWHGRQRNGRALWHYPRSSGRNCDMTSTFGSSSGPWVKIQAAREAFMPRPSARIAGVRALSRGNYKGGSNMEESVIQKMVMSVIRSALSAAAGSLIAAGTISQAQSETLIGGVLVLVAIAWSLFDKHKTAKLAQARNEIIADQHAIIQAKTAEINSLK